MCLKRNESDLLAALEEFKSHQVDFISMTEQIQTDSPMGRAFFTVIAAIAQLERELIAERVKNGLRNARAKGKLIGRKKMRASDLIRKLLKAGMSYRNISVVAKCSHGSVSAERAAMKREEAEQTRKLAEQAEAEKMFKETSSMFPVLPEHTEYLTYGGRRSAKLRGPSPAAG